MCVCVCVWMDISYEEWLREWSPLFSEASWAMILVQIRGLLLMAIRRFRGARKLPLQTCWLLSQGSAQ